MHRKLLVAGFAAAALVLAGCSSDSDGDAAEATVEETVEEAVEETAEEQDIEDVAEELEEEAAEEVAEEEAAGPTTDDSDCGAEENICIGLVTDTGKVDDKSFNQAAWEGTQLAAEQVGAFSKYIETVDPKD